MRQWNKTQPGGKGLLSNFKSYFKSLSEADKEVCSLWNYPVYTINECIDFPSHSKHKCKLYKLPWWVSLCQCDSYSHHYQSRGSIKQLWRRLAICPAKAKGPLPLPPPSNSSYLLSTCHSFPQQSCSGVIVLQWTLVSTHCLLVPMSQLLCFYWSCGPKCLYCLYCMFILCR